MKLNFSLLKKLIFLPFVVIMFLPISSTGQENEVRFWENVSFGGGLGISAGNNFFYGTISPSAIYNFNQYFSAGVGLQGSYANGDNYKASTYGGSILSFLHPLPMLRFSIELEILQVNYEQEILGADNNTENYVYPALFLGAGYRNGPVTIGLRYDVLYNEDKSVYGSPVQPFVSVFF